MRPSRRRLIVILVVVLLAVGVFGCGDDDGNGPGRAGRGSITVFAAASLSDAFDALADAYEAANPGVVVERNYAGSSSLREQILGGAPADVFASANVANMDAVLSDGLAQQPSVFATNEMAIAVPSGNPGEVEGLEDFERSGLLIGLCAEEVPCGGFGRQVLDNAGIEASADTNEPDVRALLTKVAAGELDAGLVYATDLVGGDGAERVPIPADVNVTATYPIAVLEHGADDELSRRFVAFVLGDAGQTLLSEFGFGAP